MYLASQAGLVACESPLMQLYPIQMVVFTVLALWTQISVLFVWYEPLEQFEE